MSDREKRNKLLVFGFIRQNIEPVLRSNMIIPTTVRDLCFNYFYILPFVWDQTQRDGIYLKFEEDKQGITSLHATGGGGWNICVGQEVVSAAECDCYEWTIQLTQVLEKGTYRFFIGYVNAPIEHAVHKFSIHLGDKFYLKGEPAKNQFAVFVHSGHEFFSLFGPQFQYGQHLSSQYKLQRFVQGDKLKLVFDFVKDQVALFYNGNFVNVVFRNLNERIIPAVCVDTSVKLACVSHNMHYKK